MRVICCGLVLAIGCGGPPPPTTQRASTPPVTPAPAAAPVEVLAGPDLANGERLYQRFGCPACHSIDGTAKVGASMRGFAGTTVELADGRTVVADDMYLRDSIVFPARDLRSGYPASMPPYEGLLKDAELDDLIAYIHSLK